MIKIPTNKSRAFVDIKISTAKSILKTTNHWVNREKQAWNKEELLLNYQVKGNNLVWDFLWTAKLGLLSAVASSLFPFLLINHKEIKN